MHNHQPDEHEHSRYRNRVEFRVESINWGEIGTLVDIGTEWNLENNFRHSY